MCAAIRQCYQCEPRMRDIRDSCCCGGVGRGRITGWGVRLGELGVGLLGLRCKAEGRECVKGQLGRLSCCAEFKSGDWSLNKAI